MTEEMTSACYERAKSIYPDNARITETARVIADKTGMNEGSAKYYVESFSVCAQENGLRLQWQQRTFATILSIYIPTMGMKH